MPPSKKTIPIYDSKRSAHGKSRVHYDCARCPGYCCSYPLIEVGKRDVARLARHFGLDYALAEARYTKYDCGEKVRCLRQRNDEHFGSICAFFDKQQRRCTVYEARPAVCRDYPEGKRCGYYEFLDFEREFQDDPEFVALTSKA